MSDQEESEEEESEEEESEKESEEEYIHETFEVSDEEITDSEGPLHSITSSRAPKSSKGTPTHRAPNFTCTICLKEKDVDRRYIKSKDQMKFFGISSLVIGSVICRTCYSRWNRSRLGQVKYHLRCSNYKPLAIARTHAAKPSKEKAQTPSKVSQSRPRTAVKTIHRPVLKTNAVKQTLCLPVRKPVATQTPKRSHSTAFTKVCQIQFVIDFLSNCCMILTCLERT